MTKINYLEQMGNKQRMELVDLDVASPRASKASLRPAYPSLDMKASLLDYMVFQNFRVGIQPPQEKREKTGEGEDSLEQTMFSEGPLFPFTSCLFGFFSASPRWNVLNVFIQFQEALLGHHLNQVKCFRCVLQLYTCFNISLSSHHTFFSLFGLKSQLQYKFCEGRKNKDGSGLM